MDPHQHSSSHISKSTDIKSETAVFAGGCFWCTEAVFDALKGIISVMPGYSGGSLDNPSYEQVSQGNTGHVEAVRIEYDPKIISYDDLLAVFFHTHDPTTVNRQGNDIGPQYRSVIFYMNEEQKQKAEAAIFELNTARSYDKPIVTEVLPYLNFFTAEDYHKRYYERHKDFPYCQIIIAPKLEKMTKRFNDLIR